MSSSDNSNNDNKSGQKVGYKRPPLRTRFKKGKSGNPNGRPPGALNKKTIHDQVAKLLCKVVGKKISATEDGKHTRITKLEANFVQLANKAASGDLRASQLMMRYFLWLAQVSKEENRGGPSRRRRLSGLLQRQFVPY